MASHPIPIDPDLLVPGRNGSSQVDAVLAATYESGAPTASKRDDLCGLQIKADAMPDLPGGLIHLYGQIEQHVGDGGGQEMSSEINAKVFRNRHSEVNPAVIASMCPDQAIQRANEGFSASINSGSKPP